MSSSTPPAASWTSPPPSGKALNPGCSSPHPTSPPPSPSAPFPTTPPPKSPPPTETSPSSKPPPASPSSGRPLTALEKWRYTNFGNSANTGNGADNADPDNDGVNNLAEYTAGTNPNDATSLPSFVWTSTTSGDWSTGTNWNLGTVPTSNPATKLEFLTGQNPGTLSIAATNDLPGTFQLNKLSLSGINTTTTTTVGLSGSPLRFVANGTLQPVIALTANTGGFTYTVANPLTLDATTTFSASNSGRFLFTGPISGTGGLTRTSTWSTLILSADNSYQGTTTISAGTLQIGNDGTTGTPGTGPIINNGTLRIDRSGILDLTNSISGSGIPHHR